MSDAVSRRVMIARCAAAAASSILGRTMHAQEALVPAVTLLDHLLLGSADLDRGVECVQRLTGVTAIVGGSHPGRGTRNALLSLGGRQYLEIIAPDPAQPAAGLPKDLRALTTPRLIGWAARATGIDALASSIRTRGLQVFGPRDGSRARPDGKMLGWKTLGANSSLAGGDVDPIPFFIEWSPGGAPVAGFAAGMHAHLARLRASRCRRAEDDAGSARHRRSGQAVEERAPHRRPRHAEGTRRHRLSAARRSPP